MTWCINIFKKFNFMHFTLKNIFIVIYVFLVYPKCVLCILNNIYVALTNVRYMFNTCSIVCET